MDLKQLQKAALSLPEEERAILARSLLVSLDTESESEIEQAWIAEARNRVKELDKGYVKPIPAEVAREKAKRLLR